MRGGLRGGLRGGRGARRTPGRGHGRGGSSSRGGGGRGGGGRGGNFGGRGASGHARANRVGVMRGNSPRGRGQQRNMRGGGAGRNTRGGGGGNNRQGASGFYRGGRGGPSMYPGLPESHAAHSTAVPPFSIPNMDLDIANSDQLSMRPEGINEKQDDVICHVAKYVVYSCDGAKYQMRLRQRTRHNPYFAFMDSRHPYNTYYAYLMESYRYWKAREEEGGGLLDEGNMMASEAAMPMIGQGVESYGMYGQFNEMGVVGGGAESFTASSSSAMLTGSGAQTGEAASWHNQDSSPHDGAVTASAENVNAVTPSHGAQSNENGDDDEDEDVDDDQYEMVMVNGVPTLVAKSA